MEIKIRREETKDIEQVREILCRAFPSDAESKLVDVLRANNKAIISLVAFHQDQVLGHIMFSPVFTPHRARRKELDLRLLRFILTFKRRDLVHNSFMKDCVFVQN